MVVPVREPDSADQIPERGSVPFSSGSVPVLQVRERSLLLTPADTLKSESSLIFDL
jgi:hypothetical protein